MEFLKPLIADRRLTLQRMNVVVKRISAQIVREVRHLRQTDIRHHVRRNLLEQAHSRPRAALHLRQHLRAQCLQIHLLLLQPVRRRVKILTAVSHVLQRFLPVDRLVVSVHDLPVLIPHPRYRHAADRVIDRRHRSHVDRDIPIDRQIVEQIRDHLLLPLARQLHTVPESVRETNLPLSGILKIPVRVVLIHLRHRVPVDRDNGNLLRIRIDHQQKQPVSLPAILPAGFPRDLPHVVNSHEQKCQNPAVILVNLPLVPHPAFLPVFPGAGALSARSAARGTILTGLPVLRSQCRHRMLLR